MKRLICLLILLGVVVGQCNFSTCTACTLAAGCGYCVTDRTCRAGTATGPSSGSCTNWKFYTSQTANPINGFPVSPNQIDVFLVAGVPLQVPISVTIPPQDTVPLDVFFIQDASASMSDDILNFQRATPRIINGLLNFQFDTTVGLGSFIDITDSSSYNNIWRYRNNLPLTQNYENLVTKLGVLGTTGNFDYPETALDALFYSSLCKTSTGWRSASRKIVLAITDDTSKCEVCQECPATTSGIKGPNANFKDYPALWNSYTPRNYVTGPPYVCGWFGRYSGRDQGSSTGTTDYRPAANRPFKTYFTVSQSSVDNSRLSSKAALTDWCQFFTVTNLGGGQQITEGSDHQRHPSFDQLKSTMVSSNVIPVFLASDPGCRNNICLHPRDDFQTLVNQWGFGVSVGYSNNVDGFVTTVLNAIRGLSSVVSLEEILDTASLGQSISPTTFTGLVPGQKVIFTVTLSSSTPISTLQTVVYRASGLGDSATATLRVRSDFFPCEGCDRVLNSDKVLDACGVCGGNGSSCTDCFGAIVPLGGIIAQNDACGVCNGNGTTCVGCDGVARPPPQSPTLPDLCGICGGSNSCVDCFNVPFGTAIPDQCGVCGGNNDCFGCDGVRDSGLVRDNCGVCNGTDACRDCNGVYFGGAIVDLCGVCGGNNTCIGCDGIANSGKVFDDCGVCNGTNDCYDCNGTRGGSLIFDQCNVCGGSNECFDCFGVLNGTARFDNCSVCNGTNRCIDCNNVLGGGARIDLCNVCGGNNTCVGCDGIVNSTLALDDCGVCNGNNACYDCNNVREGTARVDLCGICGGTNDCVDCNGIPYGNYTIDTCNVCSHPDNPYEGCFDCEGTPFGNKTLDLCGDCGGNSSCIGCDGRVDSGKVFDDCGICGGTNACFDCEGVAFGNKTYDLCGVCDGADLCLGCDNLPYTNKTLDACNVCGGNNSTCIGCDGLPGGAQLDLCGDCGGDGSSCSGCDGKYLNTTVDDCGVCGGGNLCFGCDDVPNSGLTEDLCGVCGGNNTCIDCAGNNFPLDSTARFELDACEKCKPILSPSFQRDKDKCSQKGVDAAVAAGSAGAAVATVAGAIAALMAYKRWKDGADWYYKDAIENAQIMGSNPLYEASGKEKFSPLYQPGAK